MARWKLTEAHYLKAHRTRRPGPTEWEHVETDRITGEEMRVRYEVPLYCDAETIISRPGSEQPNDNLVVGPDGRTRGPGPIVYEGPVTMAMEPLDAEARAISEEYASTVQHPIESLPAQGQTDALIENLNRIFAQMPQAPAPVAQSGVTREEFEAMQEKLQELLARNAELEGGLDDPPPPPQEKPERRKVA